MAIRIRGIDHIYLSVSDLAQSDAFYAPVMAALGFKRFERPIDGDPHIHYGNGRIQFSIRPCRRAREFDPYAPGLHHVCMQVGSEDELCDAHSALAALGVDCTTPREFPEYAAGYRAIFFRDPDGIRFEILFYAPKK